MTSFADTVYNVLLMVPEGKVTTYKHLAHEVGSKAYRAVGQVLRNNPYAPHVPCHRVVSSDGTIGGFMGNKSGKCIRKKKALLQKEGVRIKGNTLPDFHAIIMTDFSSAESQTEATDK
jgi:methylated-DNA-[protein]-cysteine S-methyltransferase